MPEDVQDQYNLRAYADTLDGLILCKYGLYTNDHKPIDLTINAPIDELQLCICSECLAAVNEAKVPVNAIANGNYIGYLPHEFHSISRTEEQTVALEIMQFFIHTIIGSDNKVLDSHTYVIKNPYPILREFCHDVIGTILFTLVGANVSEQIALIRQRFPMSVDDARAFLKFLDNKNLIYKAADHRLGHDLEAVMQPSNFIMDRSNDSDCKVSPKLIQLMHYSKSTYHHGTAESVEPAPAAAASHCAAVPASSSSNNVPGLIDDMELEKDDYVEDRMETEDTGTAEEIEENANIQMVFQPIMNQPSKKVNTIIAFNTTNLAERRGLGSLAYAFPTRFPYGCGTYSEPRPRKMTERQWMLRTLRLHGEKNNRNSQHYGLLAAGFDHIALMKAFRGQYVSMRVKQEAISNFGLWSKEDINECIVYKEQVEERARRGLKPHQKPEKIAHLLKMIDVIRPGMSAMYGSDESRKSALHIAFGFNIRFSNPHFFYTISPDPYSNYVVSINTSNMKDPSHVDVRFDINDVLPCRQSRKKFSNSDPFQCALYAKAVNEAFIEHFLGWSLEFKGPEKEGGALGLVSHFHQVRHFNYYK
jgi:hypothetical protein